MAALSIYEAYWSSISSLFTAVSIYGSVALLSGLYRIKRDNPALRLRASFLVLLLSSFSWGFLALSLLFCSIYAADYAGYAPAVIRKVFVYSILGTLVIAAPLAVFLRYWTPRYVVRRLKPKTVSNPRLLAKFGKLRGMLNLWDVELAESELPGAVALAVDGPRKWVVVSTELEHLLDDDELEAVLAHELSHIKARDVRSKLMATAYRFLLPFDPIVRLAEAAVYRESELRADQSAAKVTSRPLDLASALIKIHESGVLRLPTYVSALTMGSAGLLRKSPSLRLRVERLIKMSQEMHAMLGAAADQDKRREAGWSTIGLA